MQRKISLQFFFKKSELNCLITAFLVSLHSFVTIPSWLTLLPSGRFYSKETTVFDDTFAIDLQDIIIISLCWFKLSFERLVFAYYSACLHVGNANVRGWSFHSGKLPEWPTIQLLTEVIGISYVVDYRCKQCYLQTQITDIHHYYGWYPLIDRMIRIHISNYGHHSFKLWISNYMHDLWISLVGIMALICSIYWYQWFDLEISINGQNKRYQWF